MTDNVENSELLLEKEILHPYSFYSQFNDKRLSIKHIRAFNHWLQLPEEKLTIVWEMVQMLYVSLQLCDDIQDHSQVRGMLPTVHCVYGVPLTINASFHSLLLVLQRALNFNPEACSAIIDGYLGLYRGQGIEIYWRDNFICPTEEEYRKMIKTKTGSFFITMFRLQQAFSENKTDYSRLIYKLGSFFQILDDYFNLKYKEGLEGWPEEDKKVYDNIKFCEDITEGKFSLPVIHAMQTEYADQIRNILRQRTRDVSLKKYFVSMLEKAGSLEYTRNVVTEYEREVRAEMARFGGNPELEALLDLHLNWQKRL